MNDLKEQLQIKSESLLILSQQLENSVKEKDEYKRLIDTLYDKNLVLKKKLYNNQQQDSPSVDKVHRPFQHFSYLFIMFYRKDLEIVLVLIKNMMILIQK